MHFFCIFLQKYLHISEIFRIFAADLGIVPAVTINNVKSMEKSCIFKANKGNEYWYLFRIPNERASRGCIYRVYCGRKWYDRISWFSYEMALGQLLEGCLGLGSVHFGVAEL